MNNRSEPAVFADDLLTFQREVGNSLIRLPFGSGTDTVETGLAAFGVVPGRYQVTVGFVQETDGTPEAELVLLDDRATEQVTLGWSFADGDFIGAGPRGDAAQAGNFKTLTFADSVTIGAGWELALTSAVAGGAPARVEDRKSVV